ncbi:MAG: hypothetical protein ACXVES_05380 [Actinomycetota bacterium]
MERDKEVGMIGLLAAVVNMDKPAHYIHWGWFQISLPNLLVIILMFVVFVLALVIPFVRRDT